MFTRYAYDQGDQDIGKGDFGTIEYRFERFNL